MPSKWREARRAGTEFGQWPFPPLFWTTPDPSPTTRFVSGNGRGRCRLLLHPLGSSTRAFAKASLSPPYLVSVSFFCIVVVKKKRNTSRAANNEQSAPPTPNNRCRRDVEHGDRADAQEGQRPEARSSGYPNCPFFFSYSETSLCCCCSGSAGAMRRLHPRRRPHPMPPLGPAAADRPGASAAQCD